MIVVALCCELGELFSRSLHMQLWLLGVVVRATDSCDLVQRSLWQTFESSHIPSKAGTHSALV